jgi:hypothetical protein
MQMSVRKRKWVSPQGEAREAWVADYVDGNGQRRNKNFKRKRDADAWVERGEAGEDRVAKELGRIAAGLFAVAEAIGKHRRKR